MHLGNQNQKHTYSMEEEYLMITSEEKDLGVLIDDKLEIWQTHKGNC